MSHANLKRETADTRSLAEVVELGWPSCAGCGTPRLLVAAEQELGVVLANLASGSPLVGLGAVVELRDALRVVELDLAQRALTAPTPGRTRAASIRDLAAATGRSPSATWRRYKDQIPSSRKRAQR